MFRTIRTGSPRRSTLVVATCVSTRLPADLRDLDVEYSGAITEAIADPAFSGRSGTTASSGNVLVVGLGEKKSVDLEAVRKCGSVVRNELELRGDSGAAIEIHRTIPASVGTAEEIGQAFAEGGCNFPIGRIQPIKGLLQRNRPQQDAWPWPPAAVMFALVCVEG